MTSRKGAVAYGIWAELDGPSRTIIVEPIETPTPPPPEPDYDPEPAPPPERDPDKVPA